MFTGEALRGMVAMQVRVSHIALAGGCHAAVTS
jgi:hypothetical protein